MRNGQRHTRRPPAGVEAMHPCGLPFRQSAICRGEFFQASKALTAPQGMPSRCRLGGADVRRRAAAACCAVLAAQAAASAPHCGPTRARRSRARALVFRPWPEHCTSAASNWLSSCALNRFELAALNPEMKVRFQEEALDACPGAELRSSERPSVVAAPGPRCALSATISTRSG